MRERNCVAVTDMISATMSVRKPAPLFAAICRPRNVWPARLEDADDLIRLASFSIDLANPASWASHPWPEF